MLSSIELTILRGLTQHENFTRKVLPYIKESYYTTSIGRTLFELCNTHFQQYNTCPSKQEFAIRVEALSGLNGDEFQEIGNTCIEQSGLKETVLKRWIF